MDRGFHTLVGGWMVGLILEMDEVFSRWMEGFDEWRDCWVGEGFEG